ncbi:TPA: hypothetical protein IX027_003083 [Enterococcus faecium]|nr:hypothetical protein [Enterococcus faecium]
MSHFPQYYVENSHEAIISKELFLQAQEEIYRRSNMVLLQSFKSTIK